MRRSLKDDKRLAAERRGEMELRFAKWEVSDPIVDKSLIKRFLLTVVWIQNGKQGENKSVADANTASMAQAGSQSS